MPAPKSIVEAKQLIVEGRDAERFFKALLRTKNFTNIQVQDFGGVDELKGFLKALRNAPDFTTRVVSLGIVRDAEANPPGAFQSVCSALRNAGLSVPNQELKPVGKNPKVSVLILPNAQTPGMLETVCLEAIKDNSLIQCIDEYFHCVEKQTGSLPDNMQKARVHAYLASCSKPNLSFGESADAGYWPWNKPAFEPLRRFLQAL